LYLKKLEIQGFKSFADRTTIEFNEDITAIVGPNGSGKSNISDAIRWVLGEQSVKSLRGNKMEDVIFSGTDKRRPLGFAEVTIYFDNSDNSIPVDYNEVAITRRMFRSGESEYYINKTSCRLKDVRALFMDTGIGKDGYSIIGQGRIDEILSNKPEDRRNIFEEAAGIIKYKTKKDETERKLKKTQDNLVRIKDLLSEIQNQYDSLEVESKKAKEYMEIYEELKFLEVNQSIREIDMLKVQLDQLKTEIELDTNEICNLENQRTQLDSEFNELKEKIKDMDSQYEELRNNRLELIQTIDNSRSQIKLMDEKEKFYKRDIERFTEELENLREGIQSIDEELIRLDGEIEKTQGEYKKVQEEFLKKKEEFQSTEEKLTQREVEIEREKEDLIHIYNKISEEKSLINGIHSFQENIDKRLSQLNKDLEKIHGEILSKEEELNKLDQVDLDFNHRLNEINDRILSIKAEKLKLTDQLSSITEEIRQVEIKLQGLISSYNLYRNMEEGYEGYYKSVKHLLESIKNKRLDRAGFEGIIADLIQVDSKYEKAIDISLGSNLQNVVVADEYVAKGMIDYLKKNRLGRVTFLPLNVIRGSSLNLDIAELRKDGVIDLAHRLIEYDPKYNNLMEYLLGRTIIVDNMDNAIKLANRFNHKYRLVTLDGELFNPGGSLTGGSYSNNAISIIGRKNRILKLKEDIQELSNLNRKLQDEKNKLQKDLMANDQLLDNFSKDYKELEIKIINNRNNKEGCLREIDRLRADFKRVQEERQELEAESKDYLLQMEEYEFSVKELEEKIEDINKRIKEINNSLSEEKALREEKNRELTEIQINLNKLENKLNNLKEGRLNCQKEREEKLNSIRELEENIKSTKAELEGLGDKKIELNNRIEELGEKEAKLSLELEDYTKGKEGLMENFYRLQDDLKIINERLMVLEKQKNKRELNHSRLELKIDNLNNKLLNDYEFDYETALATMEISEELIIPPNRIRELKDKIKALGNVNLGAIEDFESVKERLEFIRKQYDDLVKSKGNLEKLIREMENTMREQFMLSFKEINDNFTKVFKILFNGGKAKLELEAEGDVLTSGIEIKVQPPGKRLQNLSLLSGGERALTAVALLFAILETRPSPFCVLDEIDAALDEANISRFTNYLRKFSDTTQFILITHRKTTMEISDVLYGVTMAEEGVSRLISIKMEDHMDEDMDELVS